MLLEPVECAAADGEPGQHLSGGVRVGAGLPEHRDREVDHRRVVRQAVDMEAAHAGDSIAVETPGREVSAPRCQRPDTAGTTPPHRIGVNGGIMAGY